MKFRNAVSRRNFGLAAVLVFLLMPAIIATSVEAGHSIGSIKPTPTPKKKATPTPKRAKATPTPKKSPAKSTAKTKPTPKPSAKSSKTPAKSTSKTPAKSTSKSTTAKSTDKKSKTSEKDKKSKTAKSEKPTAKPKTQAKTTKPAEKPSAKTTVTKPKEKPVATSKETKTEPASEQIIVNAFAVPLRNAARASAPTMTRVKIGSRLKVMEKSDQWIKVQYQSGGKTSVGWIASNSVNSLASTDRMLVYRQIVERAYKPDMDFASASELHSFMADASGDLDKSDSAADFELKRLLVLRAALKQIPVSEKEAAPYAAFIKENEQFIVYNEPAGVYLVAANQFWDLHTKYQKSVVSDSIAWEGALNPLPGECEGYVNCYLFDMRMRFGEYLNTHPNGKHSAEALTNITNLLQPIVNDSGRKEIYSGPTDVTDRAEFNNLIAEIRTIVSRLTYVEKERTLAQLRQIAEAYR